MVLVLLLGEGVRVGVLLCLLLPLDFLRRVVLLLLGHPRRVNFLCLVGGLLDLALLLDVLLRRQDPLRDQLWGQWVQIKGLRLFLCVVG